MSISEVSSQTTLLTASYIGSDFSNTTRSLTEHYREKYKDRNSIYEDWLKTARSSIKSMTKEIDSKINEIKAQQKTSAELYADIIESDRLFQTSMNCVRHPKKRKISEIEE